ncbi:MAG: hypothetical protein HC908_17505 [Calothrix sp. SM1_7_51]|nr:hypothetical protein [Calothrix sp. SM1_7_51]
MYGKLFFFSLSGFQENGFEGFIKLLVEGVNSQQGEVEGSGLDRFVSNFSYPFYSLGTALNAEYPLRLFIDWIIAIITFLPERLLNIQGLPESITPLNTGYILRVDEVTFGIPPGLLAFAVYSLSWTGLVFVCFTYGWIGRYFETVLLRHVDDAPWVSFLYAVTAQIWIDYYTAGDPLIFLFADFWALAGCFFFVLLLAAKYLLPRILEQNNRN